MLGMFLAEQTEWTHINEKVFMEKKTDEIERPFVNNIVRLKFKQAKSSFFQID